MSTTITLKATGLNTSPNQLELPEGSLTEAKNVLIRRDNVIEPMRGYKLFGTGMGSESDRAKTLFEYRESIFRHYLTTLQFQDGVDNDGVAEFTSFAQTVQEAQAGLRIKKIESNGNLYFTSSEGIKKISAVNGAGLSSAQITNAGGIKAVDLTADLVVEDGDQSSFLPQDSAVAYRTVWATKDANGNLIVGTPSQREEVYNPLSELLVRDFSRVLRGLDGVSNATPASLINDANYVDSLKLPLSATSPEIQTNLVALASKIDTDILIAQDTPTTAPLGILAGSVSITSGVLSIPFDVGPAAPNYFSVGSKVWLTGFSPASGTLDGLQTVAAVSPSTIQINTTASGAVTVSASATIESGTYRAIEEPPVPGVPTSYQELRNLQIYLQEIITALQAAPSTGTPPTIDATARAAWIDIIDLTTTAYTTIDVTIPDGITSDYFLQLYRSAITQATDGASLSDLVPSDELGLVYEAYPTAAEITAGRMVFDDITPDEFRGANLYTNPQTGEGALQANDLPPFATDVNRFKNVVFYSNTKTRQRAQLNLLGVQNMINDFDLGTIPTLSIVSGDTSNTYTFVKGALQTSQIICNAASTLASSGTADAFQFYSGNDAKEYYVWYKRGTAVDPAFSGKTGILVQLTGSETATVVATKTAAAIASYPWDFTCSSSTTTITLTVTEYGATTATSDSGTGFAFSTTVTGVGEDAAAKQILLSDLASVALAVDATARSIVRVINQNDDEVVYGFYLSGNNEVPGKMFFEAKTLSQDEFYFLSNNAATGASFNPDISGDFAITAITTGASPTITTSPAHGLTNGDSVVIAQTNSTPVLSGAYPVYEVTATTFKIDLSVPITVAGTSGTGITKLNSASSSNETKVNRIYFSKLSQPEAVPLTNFFDVGDSDKQILRIFPLRDSLFVFKEEGLYRISGEAAPFTLALFDSSCQVTAPDTVDVNNNLIYSLTTQGVMTVSEGGVNIISRPIDNIILRIPVFPNYKTLSFGMGYESDNSYTLWTVQRASDTCATIGFRYSNLTNTWTTVDRELTCGFVNPVDDKSYHGAGDVNYLEQERKDFARTDYATREIDSSLLQGNYLGTVIKLTDVTELEDGYVVYQNQQLTVYEYNMLLKKLDIDPGVDDSDYYEDLQAAGGDSLRLKLESLTTKLDLDLGVSSTDYAASIDVQSGTITSISTDSLCVITTSAPHGLMTGRNVTITGTDSVPSIDGDWIVTVLSPTTFSIETSVGTTGTTGTFVTAINSFDDIAGCYNIIIGKLNADAGVSFNNYKITDTETEQEVIILSINRTQKKITVNAAIDFVVGPLTIFKSLDTAFTYGPNVFGNPVSFKHFRDATMMFEAKDFTVATMSFATDLLPELIEQEFNGDGNGIFGSNEMGGGFFGGGSSAAPFRTWVPRQCQRARYIVVRFQHSIARESYKVFGTTITGEDTGSSRAYRG